MTTHVMIDLETLSCQPDAAVLSIGAVKFDLEKVHATPDMLQTDGKDAIYREECFYLCCDDPKGHIDIDTVLWWFKQSDQARMSLVDAKRHGYGSHGDLFTAFGLCARLPHLLNWIGDCPIWGNGASFDNTILRNLFRRVGTPCWQPWQDRCYRTWKQGKPPMEKREGIYHNALADAYSQAAHMVAHGGF